jgi:DNA-binding NtrC family response regulator
VTVSVLEHMARDGEGAEASIEIERIARVILALPERIGSKLRAIERAVLHHAIESCGGNKSAAARLMGVDRKFLDRKIDRDRDEEPPVSGRKPAADPDTER